MAAQGHTFDGRRTQTDTIMATVVTTPTQNRASGS